MSELPELPFYTIEDIVSLYPSLYSEKRLDEWRSLFDDNATFVKVVPEGEYTCVNVDEAMPEQREYADENDFFHERWDNVEISQFGNVATVKAEYTLTVDGEVRRGIDVLTLAKGHRGWRIINLTYEQTHFARR